ncbi:lipoxygenase family protein [Oligoflexus tunisiensis]|uniref:lipoxygenase family protein n=1 Tax=Oligoflexus tunisiensis TaxID=708132 RepID=UPI000A57401E|nr:lipoxygenase family protein [Oligoflexus tunisiensis]
MAIFETPRLARDDRDPDERRKQLDEAREKFRFNYTTIDQMPISETVPDEAVAGAEWKLKLVAIAYKNRRNLEAILKDKPYVFEKELPHKNPIEIAKMLIDGDLVSFLNYCQPSLGVVTNQIRPQSFEEYYDYFKKIDIPKSSSTLFDDRDFTEYFLSGMNPLLIERVKELDLQKFPVSDHHLQAVPGFATDTLDQALAAGRLFIIDYEALSSLEPGTHPYGAKLVYAPIILFAVHPETDELHVIAIQTGQDPSVYPIFTPSATWSWTAAKLVCKSADGNYHEFVSHLGMTHLLIEPIIVATYRQLPRIHPIHCLLVPHFEGTIPINAIATRRLLSPDGDVAQLLAGTIPSGYAMLRALRNAASFKDGYLPKALERRGVEPGSALKHYPYRDDALLVWDAIKAWAEAYVRAYYKNDSDVATDEELQAWAQEVVEAGRIQGFGTDGQILDRAELVDTLTMIIFTASAQHAAVNFPQLDASLVSVQPGAGYADAPTRFDLTKEDLVDFLPPVDRAIKQVHIMSMLGSTYYTQLGKYHLGAFKDLWILDDILRFQSQLRKVEDTIKQRNKQRRKPYTHLLPSNIPNSINI